MNVTIRWILCFPFAIERVKSELGAGVMAEWVSHLLCKHEDPSLYPQDTPECHRVGNGGLPLGKQR